MHMIFLFYLHQKSIGSGFSSVCDLWGEFHGEHGAASLEEDREDQSLSHACFLLTTAPGGGVRTDGGWLMLVNVGYLRLKNCWTCGGKTKESTCFHIVFPCFLWCFLWQTRRRHHPKFHLGRTAVQHPASFTKDARGRPQRRFGDKSSVVWDARLEFVWGSLGHPERWMGSNIKLNGN